MINGIGRIGLCIGALVAGASCATPAPSDVSGVLESRIVGGTVDMGDPAVVLFDVVAGNGGGGCTASFIATTVLLTAAHCVRADDGGPLTDVKYRIYRGTDMKEAQENDWIPVAESDVHAHPQYDPETSANDIALLVLPQPVAVTPLAIRTEPLDASLRGATVRLVGYGSETGKEGPDDGFGVRRTVMTTIEEIQDDFVRIGTTGQQACDGDSGGPALLSIQGVETILATDDYAATKRNCQQGDYYLRVDKQLAFIRQFLPSPAADAGAPSDAGAPPSPPKSDAGGGSLPPSTGGSAGPNPTPNVESAPDDDRGARSSAKVSATAASGGCSATAAPTTRSAGATWMGLLFAFAAVRRGRRRR